MANFVVEGEVSFDIPSGPSDIPVDGTADFYRPEDDVEFYRVSDNPYFIRVRDVNR